MDVGAGLIVLLAILVSVVVLCMYCTCFELPPPARHGEPPASRIPGRRRSFQEIATLYATPIRRLSNTQQPSAVALAAREAALASPLPSPPHGGGGQRRKWKPPRLRLVTAKKSATGGSGGGGGGGGGGAGGDIEAGPLTPAPMMPVPDGGVLGVAGVVDATSFHMVSADGCYTSEVIEEDEVDGLDTYPAARALPVLVGLSPHGGVTAVAAAGAEGAAPTDAAAAARLLNDVTTATEAVRGSATAAADLDLSWLAVEARCGQQRRSSRVCSCAGVSRLNPPAENCAAAAQLLQGVGSAQRRSLSAFRAAAPSSFCPGEALRRLIGCGVGVHGVYGSSIGGSSGSSSGRKTVRVRRRRFGLQGRHADAGGTARQAQCGRRYQVPGTMCRQQPPPPQQQQQGEEALAFAMHARFGALLHDAHGCSHM
ncbi:hypothetical protein JKP88DRAFT_335225 [Tribonema minus]|uniref:Uncharacterized protein n=1 Tax=Tribonema minus TaxID=303371 RepID=A0A835YSU1_9STRA|nr:hypothetical protein JKP88DRAFT_335225 [Tribonema minus]